MKFDLMSESLALAHLRRSLKHLVLSDQRIVNDIITKLEFQCNKYVAKSIEATKIINITNWEYSCAVSSIQKLVRNYYGHHLYIDGYHRGSEKWPGKRKISISNITDYINEKTLLLRAKRKRLNEAGLCGYKYDGFTHFELAVSMNIKERLLKEVYDQNKEYFDNVFYKLKKNGKRKKSIEQRNFQSFI